MNRSGTLLLAVLLATLPSRLVAQTAENLVGTWRLVAASAISAQGERNNAPYGPSPSGLLIYTVEGYMSGVISHGGRTPLSGADRIASPTEERAKAFATFLAYAGRYSVAPGRITHHVEVASVENWVGTDLTRLLMIQGERLVLRTPPFSEGGAVQTMELVWERVRE